MIIGGGLALSDGRGPVLLGVTWTFTAMALLLYIVRASTNARASKGWPAVYGIRLDFVWVTVAVITALSAEVFMTVSVYYGTGIHQWELSDDQQINAAFWSWIGQVCAIFALVWGRFAVVSFLIGIQGLTFPSWKKALFVVGAAQFLINTIEVGLILNQCTPTRRLWDFRVDGDCPLIMVCSQVGYLQGSIGAFSDFFLALYPPAVIIGPLQQMKVSIKVGLCLIMGGGVIAGIAGVVKTTSIPSILKTSDISFATLDLIIWVMIEVWFIIIFGSLPTIRTVLLSTGRRISESLQGTSASGSQRARARYMREEQWTDLTESRGYEAKVEVEVDAAALSEHSPEYDKGTWHRSRGDAETSYGSEIVVTRETTVEGCGRAL